MPTRRCGAQLAGARRVLSFALRRPAADVTCTMPTWQARPLGGAAAHAGRRRCVPRCTLPACTTSRMRWRPSPARWPPACRWPPSRAGLEAFEPVKGRSRLQLRRVRRGRALTLVDDTYNANPDSVRAAIDVLAALPGPRWLVLGDMGEVGDQGPAVPCRGRRAMRAQRGIEQLWTVGALCAHAAQRLSARRRAISTACRRHARRAGQRWPRRRSVLVKGSRFMKMERVVAASAGRCPAGGAPHAA